MVLTRIVVQTAVARPPNARGVCAGQEKATEALAENVTLWVSHFFLYLLYLIYFQEENIQKYILAHLDSAK